MLTTRMRKSNVRLNTRLLLDGYWLASVFSMHFSWAFLVTSVFFVNGLNCHTDSNHLYAIAVWNSVYGFDMSCIRKQAIMEPLVDTVDQKQIVTNCQLLKVIRIVVLKFSTLSSPTMCCGVLLLYLHLDPFFFYRQWTFLRWLLVMLHSQFHLS